MEKGDVLKDLNSLPSVRSSVLRVGDQGYAVTVPAALNVYSESIPEDLQFAIAPAVSSHKEGDLILYTISRTRGNANVTVNIDQSFVGGDGSFTLSRLPVSLQFNTGELSKTFQVKADDGNHTTAVSADFR